MNDKLPIYILQVLDHAQVMLMIIIAVCNCNELHS